jgi:hypothetical protein
MMWQAKLRTLTIVSLVVAQSLFGGNAKSSRGWLSDFEEAKALAAKEGKRILILSTFCEYEKYMPSYKRFVQAAKRRFVLLRINLAKGLPQVSTISDYRLSTPSDYRLNHPLITNDDSKWWGFFDDIRVVDADGTFVKRLVSLDEALTDAFDSTSKRNKKARKDGKGDAAESQVTRLPGTWLMTPAGWMDNFRAAQEMAVREKKSLFVVFIQDNCPPDISYRDEILTSPAIVNELRKDYILVYLRLGGYGGGAFTIEFHENVQIFKELMGPHSDVTSLVTIMMAGDGTQKSVIMDSWRKVEALKKQKKPKRRYAEQQLAERFLNFIQEEQKRSAK